MEDIRALNEAIRKRSFLAVGRSDQPPPYDSDIASEEAGEYEHENIRGLMDPIDPEKNLGKHYISITFVSDIAKHYWLTQSWTAQLDLTTYDISGLMRDGFHWNPQSIVVEQGYALRDAKELWSDELHHGWRCARVYRCSSDQWEGELRVRAVHMSHLSRFDLDGITPERIDCMTVKNFKNQLVYHHAKWDPTQSFNAYYNEMPMEGYWPWPKPNHGRGAGQDMPL